MVKTKEQVLRYLSSREYSESDWTIIVNWFKMRYANGLHKARHPKTASTLREFYEWIECSSTAEGSVVIGSDFIGVFHELPDNAVFELACWYDADGILHTDPKPLRYKDSEVLWQGVDEAMTASFYQRLRGDGYSYSVSLGLLTKHQLPDVNKIFKYQNGGVIGLGVIDRYMDKAAHFVIAVTDKVEQDMWVPSANIDILPHGKKDLDHFHHKLEQYGIFWDTDECKLITHIRRAAYGERYWFINDRWGISPDKEQSKKVDTERYRNRNYFVDYGEALRFRDVIYQLRGEDQENLAYQ